MEESPLIVLLREAQERRGLSDRAMADQIGVAHTTVSRIIAGSPADTATILKIAAWLDVAPSTLIDGLVPDAFASQIASLLRADPDVAKVFQEALHRVLDGRMTPGQFRELASYAAYRFDISGGERAGDEE